MICSDSCGSLVVQLLVFGLTNGAVVALNAVGFTLAYAVSRQINLAHGNVFTLTTVIVASLAGALGITADASPLERFAALALLVACGAVCGAVLNVVVEQLAFRPFRGKGDPLAPLIATVAISFVLLGMAVRWPREAAKPYHQGVNLPFLAMPDLIPNLDFGLVGVTFTLKDALVLLLGLAATMGVARILARTRVGRQLRALAQDADMAALCGVNVNRAHTIAFAFAGILAGLGAAIFAAYYGGASAQYGLRSSLAAMTAAVLGGVGDPRGALLAGVSLGIFSSFSDYLLDAFWTPMLVLVILIALLTFRPTGLLGSAATSGSEDVPPPTPPTLAPRSTVGSRALLVALLALALIYPWLDQLAGWNRLYSVAPALLLVTLAIGLSIVVGFAGLLDLGYAAFFAIGGYTAAMLTGSGSRLALMLPELVREPWLALPLAGMVAAGFGLVFGLPSIRTRGEYLAIVTLAFGEIVPSVIWHVPEWTGGARGMSGIPAVSLGLWAPLSPMHTYLAALALAIGACVVALRLAGSRAGRAMAAVRDDEVAARVSGISPSASKLLAFAIGAGYAGVAGAISAGLVGYIEPGQFDFTLSLMVLAAVVIGGRWGVTGVVVGALIVVVYDRIMIGFVNGVLHTAGIGIDLREDNFALIGLALYLAILPRARPTLEAQTSRPTDPSELSLDSVRVVEVDAAMLRQAMKRSSDNPFVRSVLIRRVEIFPQDESWWAGRDRRRAWLYLSESDAAILRYLHLLQPATHRRLVHLLIDLLDVGRLDFLPVAAPPRLLEAIPGLPRLIGMSDGGLDVAERRSSGVVTAR